MVNIWKQIGHKKILQLKLSKSYVDGFKCKFYNAKLKNNKHSIFYIFGCISTSSNSEI